MLAARGRASDVVSEKTLWPLITKTQVADFAHARKLEIPSDRWSFCWNRGAEVASEKSSQLVLIKTPKRCPIRFNPGWSATRKLESVAEISPYHSLLQEELLTFPRGSQLRPV
jgi:hypothetical protein